MHILQCFLTGVKGFHYKQRTTYELQVYVDDGSLISEILISHNVRFDWLPIPILLRDFFYLRIGHANQLCILLGCAQGNWAFSRGGHRSPFFYGQENSQCYEGDTKKISIFSSELRGKYSQLSIDGNSTAINGFYSFFVYIVASLYHREFCLWRSMELLRFQLPLRWMKVVIRLMHGSSWEDWFPLPRFKNNTHHQIL